MDEKNVDFAPDSSLDERDQPGGEPDWLSKLLSHPGHYFRLSEAHRASCEATTLARLPLMGAKAPRCCDHLASLLALLELCACCAFGCPGDDDAHVLQRLVGRVVANANASMFLATSGYYDESLGLTRNIGEVANLLWLFHSDESSFSTWVSVDDRKRWNEFRPKEVRRRIRNLGLVVLVDEPEYSALSSIASHVGPTTAPQTLGAHRRANLGGYFSDEAFLACLNELSWAVGVTTLPAAEMLLVGDRRLRLLRAARDVIATVGGLRVTRLPEVWRSQDGGA